MPEQAESLISADLLALRLCRGFFPLVSVDRSFYPVFIEHGSIALPNKVNCLPCILRQQEVLLGTV